MVRLDQHGKLTSLMMNNVKHNDKKMSLWSSMINHGQP